MSAMAWQGLRAMAASVFLPLVSVAAEAPDSSSDLARLSLEQLAHIEVTSVSKAPELLQQAAASVYVITHEDIVRSGSTRLMEALRLAPNLLITQLSASSYYISSRGFAGNPQAQSFSNKILMLIDGRSVYTPLFSGIYSDAQDVLLDDVDRIEVISGPGSTLWGANAMNGVINVITRPSYLTEGAALRASGGNQEQSVSARYGGQASAAMTYRAYGLAFRERPEALADGGSADDGWSKGQGGFRTDWGAQSDTLSVQGDAYRAAEQNAGSADGSIAGANLVANYRHRASRGDLQVLAYYDQTERFGPAGDGGFVLHTYDLEVQQGLAVGSIQRWVVGGGERLNSYGITNQTELLYVPPRRNLTLADAFVQDTLLLGPRASLTVGFKYEDDPYWGWSPLPELRASWQATQRMVLWFSSAKAIRSPTPFDDDVLEKIGTSVGLVGNRGFRPEEVYTEDLGTRLQVSRDLNLSLTLFHSDYDYLRSIEFAVPGQFFPLTWGNLLSARTDGVEAWANWQAASWWRLSSGVSAVHERFRFNTGAAGLLGSAAATDDPSSHAEITSSMDLASRLSLDATLRYVGALPQPQLPHYCELNARLGWRPTSTLQLGVSGMNLLHARHFESPVDQGGEAIYRSVELELRWSY